MGPRKRGSKKRKSEEALGGEKEGEDTEERRHRRKYRGNDKYIGAHVGFLWSPAQRWVAAVFLGSQRSWKRPALDQIAALNSHPASWVLYLMNCGSPKEGFRALLVDEFSCCSLPGAINHCLFFLLLPTMWSVLENMSGQGSTLGGKFSELRSIVDKVRDQTRVGVCLDTCHAFAAGERNHRFIFLSHKMSKLGCHLDHIVNEPRLDHIPLILPGFEYAEQVELLYSLFMRRQ
uniref:Xylose isomerase-like TIM barrel domain-containing protein n=1 Tax=Cyclopterus lumpus TaxID=8103 RepID=A0A8C2WES5_CYCLU